MSNFNNFKKEGIDSVMISKNNKIIYQHINSITKKKNKNIRYI
jgi:hypothetical protein